MARNLSIERIDQLQRAMREPAPVLFRLDKDGEELRSQIAFANGIEVQVTAVARRRQIETLVEEALWRVRMRVDNDRGAVNIGGDW